MIVVAQSGASRKYHHYKTSNTTTRTMDYITNKKQAYVKTPEDYFYVSDRQSYEIIAKNV